MFVRLAEEVYGVSTMRRMRRRRNPEDLADNYLRYSALTVWSGRRSIRPAARGQLKLGRSRVISVRDADFVCGRHETISNGHLRFGSHFFVCFSGPRLRTYKSSIYPVNLPSVPTTSPVRRYLYT